VIKCITELLLFIQNYLHKVEVEIKPTHAHVECHPAEMLPSWHYLMKSTWSALDDLAHTLVTAVH